jgi:hypothetical protein
MGNKRQVWLRSNWNMTGVCKERFFIKHVDTGGLDVGVIGMCLTESFTLPLALDPWGVAPVTSQPPWRVSLPRGGAGFKQNSEMPH